MAVSNLDNLDPNACGLKLHRHDKRGELISCELIMFSAGYDAVNTVLRRAAISGAVKCEPFEDSMDYFADVFVSEDEWTQTVALDRNSYASLKNRWMRCKVERHSS